MAYMSSGLGINNCQSNNGGCSHTCIYTGPNTNVCRCYEGYYLKINEGSCELCSTCPNGLSITKNCSYTKNSICADITLPTMTLLGAINITIEAGNYTCIDPGYRAEDTYDGNLTSRVLVFGLVNTMIPSTYIIQYIIHDAAGNFAPPNYRTVVVRDTIPPVLLLVGASTMTINNGTLFTDPGATAMDIIDGNLTSLISITNTTQLLPENQAPNSTVVLIYSCVDRSGNVATTNRSVKILSIAPTPLSSPSAGSVTLPIISGLVGGILIIILILIIISIVLNRRSRRIELKKNKISNLSTVKLEKIGSASAVALEHTALPHDQYDQANWFHGHISRETANMRLKEKGLTNGTFLVRYKSPGVFVLTCAYTNKTYHYILNQGDGGVWEIHGNKNEVWGNTLESLIQSLRLQIFPPFPTKMCLPVAPPTSSNLPAEATLPKTFRTTIPPADYENTSLPQAKHSTPKGEQSDETLAMLTTQGYTNSSFSETLKYFNKKVNIVEDKSILESRKKTIDGWLHMF